MPLVCVLVVPLGLYVVVFRDRVATQARTYYVRLGFNVGGHRVHGFAYPIHGAAMAIFAALMLVITLFG